jgi:hypothetical protein
MKLLKIWKDTKKTKFKKTMRFKMPLKMKSNLKAGACCDWLWSWPKPEEEKKAD